MSHLSFYQKQGNGEQDRDDPHTLQSSDDKWEEQAPFEQAEVLVAFSRVLSLRPRSGLQDPPKKHGGTILYPYRYCTNICDLPATKNFAILRISYEAE